MNKGAKGFARIGRIFHVKGIHGLIRSDSWHDELLFPEYAP